MARCPACGYEDEPTLARFESVASGSSGTTELVVCPNCEAVLGGTITRY